MNRRKSNTALWYLTGFAALLVTACLILTVPSVFARYREETNVDLEMNVREPARVYLWAGHSPEDDYVAGTGSWAENEGLQELSFMVTNTTSAEDYPNADQQFQVRLIASLGAWDGVSDMKLRLTVAEGDITQTYYAEAKPIRKDTLMHRQFGEGWYFTFLDKNQKELCWTLEGGARSTIPMQLTLENAQLADTSLLQLQIVGQMTN